MKKAYIILPLLLLILFIGLNMDAEAQCAMCRAQLETADNAGADAKNTGINSGILYLMLFPYILIAFIAFLWYRSSQKSKQQANA
ncbi:hypothetical protein [Cytophaga hutchinsonii]|nr:hypothetical protein [Cytophaga hutchinsonii]SFX96522.1 hypothetical protein SAMN04487930_11529 [Cytophaga hutchinsonii ATCC 33406]